MCGCYTHRYTWQQIVELYRVTEPAVAPNDFVQRYNIAPSLIEPLSPP
jgi:putative SOS response-associated peptidase YedK